MVVDAPSDGRPTLIWLSVVNKKKEQDLLDIDKISLTRDELLRRYDERWGTETDPTTFECVIDELET